MKEWRTTLLSQYDNSPVIVDFASRSNDMLSPDTDIQNFYRRVFDLGTYDLGADNSEITKYGLQVWSDIVAQERRFNTGQPLSGRYEHILGHDDPEHYTMEIICRCTGTSGTVIPVGSKIEDDDGNTYESETEATIGTNGSVDACFLYSSSDTKIDAPAIGDVTTIVDAVSGWSAVTNITAGSSSGLGNFDNNIEELSNNWGGTFRREQTYGNTLEIADYALRRLILLKAMANITVPTLAQLNAFVYRLFYPYLKEGDYVFLQHTDTMEITLFTNFPLSPYLQAIVNDSGVMPIPAGVDFKISDFPQRVFFLDDGQTKLSAYYEYDTVGSNERFIVTPDDVHCCVVTDLDDVPDSLIEYGLVILDTGDD